MKDPVRVIRLDSFDRDLIIVEVNPEGRYTANLRDGVYGGYGRTYEEAMLDLANILHEMSRKVKREATK